MTDETVYVKCDMNNDTRYDRLYITSWYPFFETESIPTSLKISPPPKGESDKVLNIFGECYYSAFSIVWWEIAFFRYSWIFH